MFSLRGENHSKKIYIYEKQKWIRRQKSLFDKNFIFF